jgi:hypothetical protein
LRLCVFQVHIYHYARARRSERAAGVWNRATLERVRTTLTCWASAEFRVVETPDDSNEMSRGFKQGLTDIASQILVSCCDVFYPLASDQFVLFHDLQGTWWLLGGMNEGGKMWAEKSYWQKQLGLCNGLNCGSWLRLCACACARADRHQSKSVQGILCRPITR